MKACNDQYELLYSKKKLLQLYKRQIVVFVSQVIMAFLLLLDTFYSMTIGKFVVATFYFTYLLLIYRNFRVPA